MPPARSPAPAVASTHDSVFWKRENLFRFSRIFSLINEIFFLSHLNFMGDADDDSEIGECFYVGG